MCIPESLVVFKAIAGRPKDFDDIETLLSLYPQIDRRRARRRVAELSTLAEAPEMLQKFETLLAVLAEATPPPASLSAARTRKAAAKKNVPSGKRKR